MWYGLAPGWCGAVGVVRLPVVTLPTGLTPARLRGPNAQTGLPVGVQVIGPYLHDRRLLALADRLDAVVGGGLDPVSGDRATPPGYRQVP
jgi:amidase